MNSLNATIRNTKTKGEIRSLRINGGVPAIIYGGKMENQKISVNKKEIKTLIEKENFLSNTIKLKIDEKEENVLPKEITFNVLSDEPQHIDFLRIIKGGKVTLEIPVKFINNEKSPGLKNGRIVILLLKEMLLPNKEFGLIFSS